MASPASRRHSIIAAAAPERVAPAGPVLEQAFEVELNRNLAALFGRA